MPRGILAVLFAAGSLASTLGQAQRTAPSPDRADTAPGAEPAAERVDPAQRAAIRQRAALIERHPQGVRLPPVDSIAVGGRLIPAGSTIPGTVAVSGGALEVYGTIEGDAVAIDGDVVVHEGGTVAGDAVSIGGEVRATGTVLGEIRAVSDLAPIAPAAARPSGFAATRRALGISVGLLAMLAVIGIGVLMFAGSYLDAVTRALETRFARAFWIGVVGQLALLPVLLVLVLGLAITIIGLLLIPFAIVAYLLALAGVLTLGFLAVARVTGTALIHPERSRTASERAVALRALMVGLLIYLGLWVIASAFAWAPFAGAALRGLALIVTWVGLSAGLGAVLLTRAGARPLGRRTEAVPPPPDDLAWQTPTPVTGVVAARRPTPVGRPRERR